MDTRAVFILAGEASGDLHGSRLANALNLPLFGVAGPKMRDAGVECLIPMEEFQLMGFSDVIKSIPRLRRQFKKIKQAILERNPQGCILIDYPGFNLKLAKSLRRAGYQGKLIQYICPKVWAWRPGRIKEIARDYDMLLTIFPFEVELFKETPLRVEYVGNPLMEVHAEYVAKPFEPVDLALFPGSRKSEIQLNLSRMIQAAEGSSYAISVANETVRPLIQKIIGNRNIRLVEPEDSYHLMHNCRAALAVSGTVTLELALQQVPTVVVYRLSAFNAFLAGVVFCIRLPHYSLANIVAQKGIFPELMHYHFTVKNAKKQLNKYLHDTPERAQCISACQHLHEILKCAHPSLRAAELIKRALNDTHR